jgi:hypothetical protein
LPASASPVSLSHVEKAGETSSIQLFKRFRKTRLFALSDLLEKLGDAAYQLQLELIDLEFFVIELSGNCH